MSWAQAPEICPPAERLPDWDDSTSTIREKFGRMGLDDKVCARISRDFCALVLTKPSVAASIQQPAVCFAHGDDARMMRWVRRTSWP
jgi:hypothetical protein